jgi:hypothetical protein
MGKAKNPDTVHKTHTRPVSKTLPISSKEVNKDREEMIAIAAYYLAERRGFNGGDPLQDWLEAESEIDTAIYH